MASGGVPEIKKLWQKGEDLSLDGKHGDAILQFQRAKSMLLVESKALYGTTEVPQDGGGGRKLMGDILTKLSESINRDVKLINANAVHALGLKRGFTKADVKRAYRSAALKYHPDKNKDCDTSCIFAAIQSGYEKLNATLDAGEVPSTTGDAPPKRRGSASNSAEESGASYNASGGTNYFYTSHKDVGRRNAPKDKKPSPYTFDQTRQVPKSSAPPRGGVGPRYDKDVSGNSPRVSPRGNSRTTPGENLRREKATSNLSDDHLMILLKQFGFNDRQVRQMSRQELIKRYLAVSAHVGGGPSLSGNGKDGHSARRKARGSFDTADDSHAPGSSGNSGNGAPRDRERDFLKAQREASKGRRDSKYRSDGEAPGVALDDDDGGAFQVPHDFVPPPVGGTKGRTSGGSYPTAASARGGLDGFEAMAKAWASEWQKQMKKEIHREQMQYQQQLEKEIGVKPPLSKQGNRRRSNTAAGGKNNPGNGYEYTHVPEEFKRNKEKAWEAAGVKPDPGGVRAKGNRGRGDEANQADYKSPFASTHYTQKLERARKEEKIAAEALAHDKARAAKRRTRSNTTEGDTSSTSTANENGEKSMENDRARVADALRIERAAWMQERLPTMSRQELQNISTASGVSWHGNDSDDKLRKELARHYGIRPPHNDGAVSAAQAALRSKLHDSTDRRSLPNNGLQGAHSNPPNAKPGSQEGLRHKNDHVNSSTTADSRGDGSDTSTDDLSTSHSARRADGPSNAESGAPSSETHFKYISTQQMKELERRVLGPQGRDRQKSHKDTSSAGPTGSSGGNGSVPNPIGPSVAAEPSPPLAPSVDDGLKGPQDRERMRDLTSLLSDAAKKAAYDEVDKMDKKSEEEEMSRRGKAFLQKYMDDPADSSGEGSSRPAGTSSGRMAVSAKALQAAQNARKREQRRGQAVPSSRTKHHLDQDKDKNRGKGNEAAVGKREIKTRKKLPPLTIEIDEVDPAQLLNDEESPQSVALEQEIPPHAGASAGAGASISDSHRRENEEEDVDDEEDFHENEENLLARLQQKGWDLTSLTSPSAAQAPAHTSKPAAGVGVSETEKLNLRIRTNSRGGILRRAAQQEREREREREREMSAPSTPPPNISSATADTGGASAGTSGSAASAETDEDTAEVSPLSRGDGTGVEEQSGIKFGTGILDDEDDEEDEDEEESSLELDRVPKGPRVFEAVLRQQEKDEQLAASSTSTEPVVAPGRIRKMTSYTNSSPSASLGNAKNTPESSPIEQSGSGSGRTDLRLDLSGIGQSSNASGIRNDKEGGGEVEDVQEEVDFWVNSARSDMSGGNTYRDLEIRLNAELAQQTALEDKAGGEKGSSKGLSRGGSEDPTSKGQAHEGRESTPRTIAEAVAMAGGGTDSIAQVSRRLLDKYSARGTPSPRIRGPPEMTITATGARSGNRTRPGQPPMSPEEVNKEMAELRRRIAEDKNDEYLASYETAEEKEVRERATRRNAKGEDPSTVQTAKTGEFLFFG